MLGRLRGHVNGTTAIAFAALLLAMSSGAWAANRYLITSTAQISPKVLKALKGKTGAPGATGATGHAGPTGPGGTAGGVGTAGANGTNGADGKDGTSATAVAFGGAKGGCTEGGAEVKSASPAAFVCNGTKGTNGTTGFTTTLPSGKTETGVWAATDQRVIGQVEEKVSISFPIPVALAGGTFGEVSILTEKETEEAEPGAVKQGCEGTLEAPTAPAGKLCIYTGEEENKKVTATTAVFHGNAPAFGSPGTFLSFLAEGTEGSPGQILESGTWAVTAP